MKNNYRDHSQSYDQENPKKQIQKKKILSFGFFIFLEVGFLDLGFIKNKPSKSLHSTLLIPDS